VADDLRRLEPSELEERAGQLRPLAGHLAGMKDVLRAWRDGTISQQNPTATATTEGESITGGKRGWFGGILNSRHLAGIARWHHIAREANRHG
jgi:hypothetical protein